MAKKVILTDNNKIQVMPITRGELVLDQHGNQALHSNDFIATSDKTGLMSSVDKSKLDAFANSSEYITQQTLDTTVSGLNTTLSNINTRIDGIVSGGNTELENYVTKDELKEVTDDITELNKRIDNIPTNDVNPSDYVTKQEFNSFSTEIDTNLTTINNKIDNFDFDVDLTVFATKEDLKTVNTELSKKGTYSKLSTGIPKSDLSEEVQQELNKIPYIGSMEIISHYVEDAPIEGYEYELSINNPNEYHKFNGKLTKLTLKKLPSTSTNYVTNIMIDFISGSDDSPSCKLEGLFNQIKWFNGIKPSIKENTRYQISIVNNLGVWAAYE